MYEATWGLFGIMMVVGVSDLSDHLMTPRNLLMHSRKFRNTPVIIIGEKVHTFTIQFLRKFGRCLVSWPFVTVVSQLNAVRAFKQVLYITIIMKAVLCISVR